MYILDPTDVSTIMGSFRKLLRPKSWLLIEVPDFESTYLNTSKQLLRRGINYTDDDHINEWDRFEFQKLLKKQGLKMIDSEFRFGTQKYWLTV